MPGDPDRFAAPYQPQPPPQPPLQVQSELQEVLAAAVTAGPAVVLGLDAAGRVRVATGSLTATLGWPLREVLGTDSLDLVHAQDRGVVFAARRALSAGGLQRVRVRVRRRHGGWRVWEVTAVLAPPRAHEDNTDAGEQDGERAGKGGGVAVVVTAFDVTDSWRRETALAHESRHDPLTQLANRTLFLERLRAAAGRQDRHGGSYAVAYLDLDGFKTVNDTHGHAVGDRLLQDAAAVLARAVRVSDVAARLGGDEFALLMEDLHPDIAEGEVAAMLVRLTADLADLPPAPGAPPVSMSTGVVVVHPGDERSPAQILDDADTAMYRAKRARRRTQT